MRKNMRPHLLKRLKLSPLRLKRQKKRAKQWLVRSSKSAAQFEKIDRFISLMLRWLIDSTSPRRVMGKIEVLISELSDPTFAFIKDIFKKRQ
jgi:hypothetical protein